MIAGFVIRVTSDHSLDNVKFADGSRHSAC